MMAVSDKLFAGSIPEIYDRFLVPLIFDSYADALAVRIAKLKPQHLLETAAGTGVLTRAMASKLPARVHVVATDLNQPMLDRAATRQPDDTRIVWRQADALKLPFEDKSFDVVACQFGVMFFPDKVQGYREARRVLKSGGVSCLTFGTKSPKTSLPMLLRRRWQTCFRKIRHVSWLASRTVITICR
jgi:ubiquinone/menaquinone biosynthesis C-methylase UbiE